MFFLLLRGKLDSQPRSDRGLPSASGSRQFSGARQRIKALQEASMASFPQAGGPRLADFLDGLPILTRWLPGHRVIWQTGQQDGPDQPNPERHTHCSAFAAALALYLDVYLLRPPHHGQVQLANAQTAWLSGTGSFPGPTAAKSGWTAFGMSGDRGSLAACLKAANAGRTRPRLLCRDSTNARPCRDRTSSKRWKSHSPIRRAEGDHGGHAQLQARFHAKGILKSS